MNYKEDSRKLLTQNRGSALYAIPKNHLLRRTILGMHSAKKKPMTKKEREEKRKKKKEKESTKA